MDKWLIKNGNTSDPTAWNDGTLPGATDDCYADGFTGTIDEDLTVASVRTTQRTGGTAGGGWILNGGVTLTADVRPYTSDCVLFSADSPAESTIVGTIYSGIRSGTDKTGVLHAGSGTLYCVGSIMHRYNYGSGVVLTGTGILDVTGSVAGYYNGGSWGIRLNGSGTARVTGEVYSDGISIDGGSGQLQITGSVASSDYRAINIASSSAATTITGTVSGGTSTNAHGITNSGAGPIIVIGDVAAGTARGANGIFNNNSSAYIAVDGNLIAGTGGGLGVTPIYSQNLAIINPTHHSTQYAGGSSDSPVYDGNIYTYYGILATGSTSGQPAESDVRKDTVYGPSGELTGTLAVPPASAVGVGVPVDDTVGTAALTADSVWDYVREGSIVVYRQLVAEHIVAIELANLANNTYRQGAKIDLANGLPAGQLPAELEVTLAIKPSLNPVTGGTIGAWLGWSSSSDAATDNPANLSGIDAIYTGYNFNPDESVIQLLRLSPLILTPNAITQRGELTPAPIAVSRRYVIPVIKNASGHTLSGDSSDHVLIIRTYIFKQQPQEPQ